MSAAHDYRPLRPALSRTLAEAASLLTRGRGDADLDRLAASVPRGDGHAVLVMPTSLGSDAQTERLLASLAERHGPVSVVGFSMGGLFARWLAVRQPAMVRSVITVCSPVRAPLDSLFMPLDPLVEAPLMKAWGGKALLALAAEMTRPFAAPATFIYSRDDGIVAWASCCDSERPDDNIETSGPHVTIAENRDVFRIIAERLARTAGG